MERDFRMFKEKMEGDMQQTTDYKETIQQLQSKGLSWSLNKMWDKSNFVV
jgi:hypothetical protein